MTDFNLFESYSTQGGNKVKAFAVAKSKLIYDAQYRNLWPSMFLEETVEDDFSF